MKPKVRTILELAIEEGTRIGYRRAHKHSDNPDESWILETVQNEIMNCIDMYFNFEDDYELS